MAKPVELEPLSAQSAAELVRALVGDALPADLVGRIAEASGGNPLFVEGALAGVGGKRPPRTHTRTDGRWRARSATSSCRRPSRASTQHSSTIYLRPRAPSLRRASVAGRQFPTAALEALGSDGHEGLDVLARRGIVGTPIADPVLGQSFVFRHALLRDVGYASLARAERAVLHVRMARWLEGRGRERPAEIAEVTGPALRSRPDRGADAGARPSATV